MLRITYINIFVVSLWVLSTHVILKGNLTLNESLKQKIKDKMRQELGPLFHTRLHYTGSRYTFNVKL